MKLYTVITRDVDGGDSRKYRTLEAAVARFESMSGWAVQNALGEQFYQLEPSQVPTIENFVGSLRAVSSFGCVVTLVIREDA